MDCVEIVGLARRLWLRSLCDAAARGVALRFSSDVDALWIRADGEALAGSLGHLMTTALCAAVPGGEVWLRCAVTGDFVELSARGDGAALLLRVPVSGLRVS